MKRFSALLLIFTLVFTLVACGGEAEQKQGEQTTGSDSSAVTYFDGTSEILMEKSIVADPVTQGTMTIQYHKIDEVPATAEVKLKMSSNELLSTLTEGVYDRNTDNEKYIRYRFGGADFYYTNDDQNHGLAVIVSNGTAYGFEPSVTTLQNVISVLGETEQRGAASEEARSLFLFRQEGVYLDYTFGTNHVAFYFVNDTLAVTLLYQEGLWNN